MQDWWQTIGTFDCGLLQGQLQWLTRQKVVQLMHAAAPGHHSLPSGIHSTGWVLEGCPLCCAMSRWAATASLPPGGRRQPPGGLPTQAATAGVQASACCP